MLQNPSDASVSSFSLAPISACTAVPPPPVSQTLTTSEWLEAGAATPAGPAQRIFLPDDACSSLRSFGESRPHQQRDQPALQEIWL